jgi:hypothetical protein
MWEPPTKRQESSGGLVTWLSSSANATMESTSIWSPLSLHKRRHLSSERAHNLLYRAWNDDGLVSTVFITHIKHGHTVRLTVSRKATDSDVILRDSTSRQVLDRTHTKAYDDHSYNRQATYDLRQPNPLSGFIERAPVKSNIPSRLPAATQTANSASSRLTVPTRQALA